MKLLRRGNSDNPDDRDSQSAESSAPTEDSSSNVSSGKGRPTPKRREAEARRRGPVAPPPMTSKEARERRKANRGTKEDRKKASAERRAASADRRSRMLAGEDKYLLPRDKGPVRAYVRDLVDARRNLVGLFMPMALLLIFALFLNPAVQAYVTLAMFVMMLFMVIEGVFIGRLVNNRVRARFPDTPDGGFKLGWYAFVRASQIRKMRAPKPRVERGAAV
ncbi:DUF3043 domain-containing protein [Rhodococcus kyotonensis]|uniref:DUF3043 domain-containing protein n=1 Tax=Rhodococcoides kyotonense TaxID=398843 RepID=A0A177YQ28_9NOCA|nr:DUF3043 domain-containing protein [Rhodococcus kyotonensis]NIL74443.1 Uncharacterized protein [Rhodococcus sp. B10]OAK57380.1 hypothetical protein A3K89_00770 [Rhodococcus kyotonensis]